MAKTCGDPSGPDPFFKKETDSMINLYEKSKYRKQMEVAKKIRDYIEIRYTLASKKISLDHLISMGFSNREKIKNYQEVLSDSLQSKIDRHTNRQAYTRHRNDLLFSKKINRLYEQYASCLDSTEKAFLASFADTYQQKVYELITAEFLDKQFKLNTRVKHADGDPDLEFFHNSDSYYLECTTRNSSLMDEYVKQLDTFNSHLKAAKIFHACRQRLINANEYGWEASWEIMMEQLWHKLSIKEQKKIISLSKPDATLELKRISATHSIPPKSALESLEAWVDINWYAMHYFRNLLPNILIKKMKSVLPSCGHDTKDFPKFLIESIVKMMIRKLKNPYFEKSTPVVLALSLSTLPDFMSVVPAFRNFELMAQSIANELRQNIDAHIDSSDDKDIIYRNLKSLYAIIIDTTWYNWLPEIVEKKHDAKWSNPKKKNCYIVIYNTSISPEIPHTKHIFSHIENNVDLELI